MKLTTLIVILFGCSALVNATLPNWPVPTNDCFAWDNDCKPEYKHQTFQPTHEIAMTLVNALSLLPPKSITWSPVQQDYINIAPTNQYPFSQLVLQHYASLYSHQREVFYFDLQGVKTRIGTITVAAPSQGGPRCVCHGFDCVVSYDAKNCCFHVVGSSFDYTPQLTECGRRMHRPY